MFLRFTDPRRAARPFRRSAPAAALAALALAALVMLAALGIRERQAADHRAVDETVASATDEADAILDRDRRLLDAMARGAATDAGAGDPGRGLATLAELAPDLRAIALFDPAGGPLAPAPGNLDRNTLATLGAAAARAVTAQPGATLLVLPQVVGRDDLAALARPWAGANGVPTGIAAIAFGRDSFAALDRLPSLPKGSRLDLLAADGTPLFAADRAPVEAYRFAIPGSPVLLRYRPAAGHAARLVRAAVPFALAGLAALAAGAGLVLMLLRHDRALRREIARRADAERELRHELAATAAVADRSDTANRAKSRFFAQVTHELRTPLNAILGFSETIRQEMFGPVANPRYLEYAGLIHDAGSHLLSLINDLLDNARIEAGKIQIAPIRVSAAAVARSALDLVELLAKKRGVTLVTSGLGECPDLNIDRRAMKQVLVNLLSNAIKYTPRDGKIDLRFLARGDGSVDIEVVDTGAGMSAEDVLHAFEPFGRAGVPQARRQPGTGLGLSLARALVRLHGGDLTLASRLDAGTTATVSLPPSAAFAPPGPRPATADKPDAAAA